MMDTGYGLDEPIVLSSTAPVLDTKGLMMDFKQRTEQVDAHVD